MITPAPAAPATPPTADERALAYCDERIASTDRELRTIQATISADLATVDRMRMAETELKTSLDAWKMLRTLMVNPALARPCSLCIEACEFCAAPAAPANAGRD